MTYCVLPALSCAQSSFDDLMETISEKVSVINSFPQQSLTNASVPRSIDAKKTAFKIDNNLNLKFNVNPFNSREHFQTIHPSSEAEYEVGLTFTIPF